jgi:hypothetical protein
MLLRSISKHVKDQNWFAVGTDLIVVVVGVFVGIQVANWNEERLEAERKQQIVEAIITDINDSIGVQQGFVDQIDAGLREWESSYARGDKPVPYYFRIEGSDVPPDTWGTLQQTQLVDLFDPATLFDLSFYYSEQAGVGRKFVRYVTFVEGDVLPYTKEHSQIFYEDGSSRLKPIYQANINRLKEFRDDSVRLINWAKCLVFRLQSDKHFYSSCLRAGFVLDGMSEPKSRPEA